MSRLVALAALLLGGCLEIPGSTEGGPCNQKGVCSKGLSCEEGICKPEAAVTWEKMLTPKPVKLNAVWGTSDQSMVAVGDNGTIFRYRRDGEDLNWDDETNLNQDPKAYSLNALWGRAENDIWAVGINTILHYDGVNWKRQPVTNLSDGKEVTAYTLHAVVGGINVVYAAGRPSSSSPGHSLIVKYDEKGGWLVQSSPVDYEIQGLAAVDGQLFTVGSAQHISVLGATWTSFNLEKPIALTGVWGSDKANVYAVGPPGVLLHFDGENWKDVVRYDYDAYGIAGRAPNDFFIVGRGGGYGDGFRQIEHCTPACGLNPTTSSENSSGLTQVWVSPDGKLAVAVGGAGNIYRRRR